MSRRLACSAVLGALALAGAARPARAQILESVLPNGVPGFNTAPGTTVLSRIHPGYEGTPIQLGGYVINANLSEQVGYESNVLGSTSDARSSPVIITSPTVSVDRSWTDGDVNASATFQNQSFPSISQENYNTDTITLGGSHDFGNDVLTAGYAHLDTEIVPTELNFLNALNPIPVSENVFRAQYQTQFGRFTAVPNLSYTTTTIGNTIQDGVYDEDSYLDQNEINGGLNLDYELATQRQILLIVEDSETLFPKTNPVQPNLGNNNAAIALGYQDNSGGVFNYFIIAGWQVQSFDSSEYGSQSQPIAEGGIVYLPTETTTLSLVGRHEIEQATQPDQIGFTYDHVGFEIDHELRRNIILSGTVDYDRDSLAKSNLVGTSWSLTGTATYRVNRHLSLSLNLTYTNYSDNQGDAVIPTNDTLLADGAINPLALTELGTISNGDNINNFIATVGMQLGL